FMNQSGRSVGFFCNYYRIDPRHVLVVHDDLDLAPGSIRLKTGGGHGGHNGLRDIINALGSRDFHRLRIGIGHPGDRNQVVDYVLSTPSKADSEAIEGAIAEAEKLLPLLLEGEFQRVMNRLHAP
ncbi:MAG TPA: peptidyl-tRNA hydrolase, partial [Chromatiales bacterium]|nr:peptidyl-tRNA hydrolase [Chromatiales bacterium]